VNHNTLTFRNAQERVSITLIASFFISVFITLKGYIIVPAIFFIFSLVILAKSGIKKHKYLHYMLLAYLLYLAPFLINLLLQTSSLRSIDSISRGLLFVPISLYLLKYPISIRPLTYILSLSCVVAFLGAVYAFLNDLSRGEYIAGINAVLWSESLAAVMSVLVAFLIFCNEKHKQIALLIVINLGVSALVLSATRGALLSWLGVIAVCCIYLCYKVRFKFAVVILLSTVLSIIITMQLSSSLYSRVSSGVSSLPVYIQTEAVKAEAVKAEAMKAEAMKAEAMKAEAMKAEAMKAEAMKAEAMKAEAVKLSSVTLRFELWKGAFKMFKERPIAGVGDSSARHKYTEYIEDGVLSKQIDHLKYGHLHSTFFDIIAKRGILGLLGFVLAILILSCIFYQSRLTNPAASSAGFLVLISFGISGLTDSPFVTELSLFVFFMLMSLLVVFCCTKEEHRVEEND